MKCVTVRMGILEMEMASAFLMISVVSLLRIFILHKICDVSIQENYNFQIFQCNVDAMRYNDVLHLAHQKELAETEMHSTNVKVAYLVPRNVFALMDTTGTPSENA